MSPVTLLRALRTYITDEDIDATESVAALLDALETSVVERALNRGAR